ncbi:MAG TPA: ABC transporter substrate-binding protein [Acetobacteraceae bacterium]|nr:ABC transporter substrate-binding protein [Acetobacteraceae bacterium]
MRHALAASLLSLALAGPALAQNRTLVIGASSAPTGMDPHYHSSNMNNAQLRQVFNTLIDLDTAQRMQPVLAESWRAVSETVWEFRLREGVRFHDGTPLTADDVAFTFARVPTVPNSPGPFTPSVRLIERVEVVDPRTIRFHTRGPHPFLDHDVAAIFILSRRIHENATLADFNAGRAMIGTGAYRHVSYSIGERHEIVRNPDFWGPAQPWERVSIRVITNAGARVAALLAGDVDLIDTVPSQDVARLEREARIAVFGTEANTTAYLFPDATRPTTPFVTDRQGRALERNPLSDLRVRQALSLAINRQAITERLLSGQGRPADQFAAPRLPGRATGLQPLPFDQERARRLLAEAGYPDGFRITIHSPNGWFAGDADVMQAIAQGWTRIGVETRVEVLPPANLFTRATAREFSVFMTTFTANYAANMLRQVVMTRDPATGAGPFNRQHWSSPRMDALVAEAFRTLDPERRDAVTGEAMRIATEELGVIPIFFLRLTWAAQRNRVRYDPDPRWYTNALLATPLN